MNLTRILLTSALLFAQSAPVIRVNTRLVYVDVTVRDENGHVVKGLKEDDFTILENGTKQKVVSFVAHEPVSVAETANSAPKLHAGTSRPQGANASSAFNMLLLDLDDTPVQEQPYARLQMIAFLKSLPPGQPIALFVLSDQLHTLQGVSGSSDLLTEAAKLTQVKDSGRVDSRWEQMRTEEDAAYIEQGVNRAPGPSMAALLHSVMAREDKQNLKARYAMIAAAFKDIANAVAGLPGRKNLLWLSGEFPIGLVGQLQIDALAPASFVNTPGSVESELGHTLADSQIAVYPVSVYGVETNLIGADFSGLGTAQKPKTAEPIGGDTLATSFQERQDLRETMNAIADATGGRAIYGTNDFAGALRKVVEESASSYTLAYKPTDTNFDGALRRVRVSLSGRGYTLTYRHSYIAASNRSTPVAQPVRLLAAAMEPGKPVFSGLGLTAEAKRTSDKAPVVHVSSRLDIGDIAFNQDEDGTRHAEIAIMVVGFSSKMGTKDDPPLTSSVVSLDLKPAQYQALLHDGLHLSQSLELPADKAPWFLRTGAVDAETGQVGTVHILLP